MDILKGYILSSSYIVLILIIAMLVKKYSNFTNNVPRKIVHIGVAFTWFIMYKYFGASYHLLFVPIITLVVNLLSRFHNTFSFIPLLSDNRDSGTYLYPLSMLIMSITTIIIPEYFIAYGVGLLSMALGDGLASIFGNKFKSTEFRIFGAKKTFVGCLTVFFFTSLITYLLPLIEGIDANLIDVILIGFVGMILEFIGAKIADNITLPIGISLLAYFLVVI